MLEIPNSPLYDGVEEWLVRDRQRSAKIPGVVLPDITRRYTICPNCGLRVFRKRKMPHTETAECVAVRACKWARAMGLKPLSRISWASMLEEAGWQVWRLNSMTEIVTCSHPDRVYCGKQTRLEAWTSPLAAQVVRMLSGTSTTRAQRVRFLEAVMWDPDLASSAKALKDLASYGKHDYTFASMLRDVAKRR